ncbi:hypothetical protein B0J14DRAFT_643237 [Halenospora varia]|nr:hypothetical protein B0J14DRAFT_643237 [Halenospora varia]
MNISAPFRKSCLRTSTSNYEVHEIPRLNPPFDNETGIRTKRSFKAVGYAEYKTKCDELRIEVASVEVEARSTPSFFLGEESQPDHSGFRNILRRMLTIYAYKDMNWLVAIIFTFGSAVFTVNAFFGFLPVVAPSTNFQGEATVAFPATLTIGASTFFSGGVMGILAAFNVDRGGSDEKIKTGMEGNEKAAARRYQPALLGSQEWVWVPTWGEFRTVYWPNPAFKAGLIQFIGGLIFSISAAAGFPGVIDVPNPANLLLVQAFIFFPQVLGGFLFMVSGIMLMILEQERWYAANIFDLNWQAAFWSTIGAISFLLSGALLIVAPAAVFGTTLFSLVGSWAFLLGSIIKCLYQRYNSNAFSRARENQNDNSTVLTTNLFSSVMCRSNFNNPFINRVTQFPSSFVDSPFTSLKASRVNTKLGPVFVGI